MQYLIYIGATISVALIIIGASYGISKISKAASEAIGRQPEAADKIQQSLLLPIACIEGATLFAIVVCLLVVFK